MRNAFITSNWNCIIFCDRVLIFDAEDVPKNYNIKEVVPQGSVVGPLLWNIIAIGFAEDVLVVIVTKY